MKINVFEGARRITRLVAIIWIIGWSYNFFALSPPIYNYFPVAALKPKESIGKLDNKQAHNKDTELKPWEMNWDVTEKRIDWSSIWNHFQFISLWAFGGVIFIYAFSWSIGWIVRGFAGIPSGKDSKA